jgi:hypothetical protein
MRKMIGLILIAAAVSTAACSDSTGVEGTAPVDVSMRMDGSTLSAAGFAGVFGSSAMEGVVPSQVDSLFVLVTSVSFLPAESEDSDSTDSADTEWIFLVPDTAIRIDLMALPTDDDSLFVTGELPVGDYRKIRMQVSDAAVWFNETITQGPATLDPNTEHPVDVPSGSTSGIKTDLGFTVEDDGNATPAAVNLLFDPSLTFSNLHVTGSGKVMLSPVFKTP